MSEVPDAKTWATGDDDITQKQAELLKRLCEEHSVPYNPGWTKAEASAKIDELKHAPTGAAAQSDTSGKNDTLLENPSPWTTGDDDATDKQKRYIAAMESRLGEDPSNELAGGLTKSAASAKIDELKQETAPAAVWYARALDCIYLQH